MEHGTWNKKTRLSGVGVVIQDCEGEVMGAYSSKKTGFVDFFFFSWWKQKLKYVHLSLHMK